MGSRAGRLAEKKARSRLRGSGRLGPCPWRSMWKEIRSRRPLSRPAGQSGLWSGGPGTLIGSLAGFGDGSKPATLP